MTWSLFFITWIASGVAARIIAAIVDKDEVMLSEIIAGAIAGYIALVLVIIGILDQFRLLERVWAGVFSKPILDFRPNEDKKSKYINKLK